MRKNAGLLWAVAAVCAVSLSSFQIPVCAQETAERPFVMPVGDMAPRVPTRPLEMLSAEEASSLNEKMAAYQAPGESLLVNRARNYFYYNTLDPTTKQIYDLLYQVACDPTDEGNIALMMTDEDPSTDEFFDKYNLAYRAICFDHPELFWLYSGEEADISYASEALTMNGLYYVYFHMREPFANFTQQMTAFNKASDEFLAQIDTSGTQYDTIRQIHDHLIDLVNYDDATASAINFGWGQDLAHTAYGALVQNSDGIGNYAVCDGYTLTIEYMCQQCGIDVAFIGGMAGPDEQSAGGHAWNVVKIDGEWYELDSTWDDLGNLLDDFPDGSVEQSAVQEMLDDESYSELFKRRLFLVSTDRISHFEPGEEYIYVSKDQSSVWEPAGESIHYRIPNDGIDEHFDGQIIQFAPVADMSYSAS